MSIDANEEAQDLVERFDDEYADEITVEEVEEQINSFIEYDVGGDEAIQGAVSKVCEKLDVNRNELFGEDAEESQGDAEKVDIADINSEDEWVTIEGEITHLWDNNSDAVSQVGMIDDGTDSIKFLAWSKGDVPMVTEGDVFRFSNVVTREEEYEGETRMAVHLNSATDVEMSDAEISLSTEEKTITGAFLDLQSGSGLIEREQTDDDTLGRVVGSDFEGETEHDLRIRGVLDTGEDAYQMYITDQEVVEAITGITLEEAKQMARDALDRTVVKEEMEPMFIGKYWTATGVVQDDAFFVNEIEEADQPDVDVDDLLVRARSL